MIVLAAIVAVATLIVGMGCALGVRRLTTVRSQVLATALVSLALPLIAVSVSGVVMFHMGADVEILVVSAAAAAAAFGCALVVAASISRRLLSVQRGAAAVASGAFEARVPVEGPTELSDLARSFNAMAESIEELFATRRELVAWASHDLRSPIASLQAMIEATADGVVPPDHYLEAMSDRVRALSGLVDDLFELASLDAGALSLEIRDVPILALVDRCVRSHTAEAEQRGIRLVNQLAEDQLGVRCAPEAVERVLGNLVANAFRYTPKGGSVTVAARQDDGRVAVMVADTGIGFGHEGLVRATEPFWRADESRTIDDQGRSHAGLGLAIAKGLIELQGGQLSVSNDPDGGGQVSFTLAST